MADSGIKAPADVDDSWIEADQAAFDATTKYKRQVTRNAVRAQWLMAVIQPLAIAFLSLVSLAVIGVGAWHLLAPGETYWLDDQRRYVAGGLAGLAATGVMLRAVLVRFGNLPKASEQEEVPAARLTTEIDERFDGMKQQLDQYYRLASQAEAEHKDSTARKLNRLEAGLADLRASTEAGFETIRRELS